VKSAAPIAVVTGGAGFIGSHMVDLLREREFHVRVIDNLATGRLDNLAHRGSDPGVTVKIRDLREIQTPELFDGAEYVFHFAGIGDIVPSVERPIDYMAANVLGTVHALEGARKAGVRKFVYAASSSCYGLATDLPTSENAPIAPEYP